VGKEKEIEKEEGLLCFKFCGRVRKWEAHKSKNF
jgi:hypothetical protein